jgi:hypothetical protein
MMSKIGGVIGGGGWKYAHGTAHYGRNFNLRWLKVRLNPFACYTAADSLEVTMSSLVIQCGASPSSHIGFN